MKKELNHELKLAGSIITESLYQSYLRLEFEPETNKDKETDPLHPAIPESPWEKKRKDAEYKKRLDELLAKIHADEEARREKERKELEAQQERKHRKEADTGYHGSFDELYEMASAISEENIRSYKDRRIQMIVDELIRAGATAQNFYQIKTESLAEAFLFVGDTDSSLIPLIIKVEQKLGVAPNYEKNLTLVNAILTDARNYGEKQIKQIR